ncbi:type II toxin-antitoxin system VapC family toxin [Paracraurococcus lichenis]|uniref:Type II toxin-antitoxin system VapC family toxin n=1 Tax=Paracraurococcus lichenis TaxID=3064888 RepID=A0ABT9E3I8_9PROT|nr:type II toxin-antitoxin system VapC family toxin [Paracraurococcus sp. LOR1-02]MDO9710732.1 type II toxin-antitoxin system VapC family toxin [Paracraurococcus sp. LOR1-02]
MTCVDSNVLLDVIQADPAWVGWSRGQVASARARGPLLVNDVVFAEIAVGFEDAAAVQAFLDAARIQVQRTPPEALFLASRDHLAYRRQGGTRSGVLPDFFIGAHAAVAGLPLITRDPRRYRAYFPTLRLIAP